MIEKRIHYCWFGSPSQSDVVSRCLDSWKRLLPDYEIKLWNELNSPMHHPYVQKMYSEKHWAFVSDYVRLYALYTEGGVYLDTDMEVLKKLDVFLLNNCFIGFEDEKYISCGIIGSVKSHHLIKDCLDTYDKLSVPINIPLIFTDKLHKYGLSSYGDQLINDVRIYQAEVFYPWPHRTTFSVDMIKENSYTVHHWQGNWEFNIKDRLIHKIQKVLGLKYF